MYSNLEGLNKFVYIDIIIWFESKNDTSQMCIKYGVSYYYNISASLVLLEIYTQRQISV